VNLPARLTSIDALRGAAAMSVVLYHTNATPGVDRSLWFGDAIDDAMFLGKFGVWLFFVISGFCIHLQWVRAQVNPAFQPLGFVDFWKRRIRRLYPPYLVTLAIYIWIRAAGGQLGWDAESAWRVFLHLFMLQNLDPGALSAMNLVYWTLAVEEQLYLLYFPFLAIRQRWGWGVTLAVAVAARAGWFGLAMVLHRGWDIDIVVTQTAFAQWFIWLLGALSIEAFYGLVKLPAITRSPLAATAVLAVASTLSWAQNYWLGPGLLIDLIWLGSDFVWGIGFFLLMNWAVSRELASPSTLAASRVVTALATVGVFSYSLYLTHEIIEWHVWPPMAATLVDAGIRLPHLVAAAGLLAACLVFARGFYQFFERPFLSRTRKATTRAAVVVA